MNTASQEVDPKQAVTALRRKDLLGIAELSPEEIELILDTAEAMKEVGTRPIKKVPALARQDGHQPLLRAQHADADLIRNRRETAER